MLESSTTAATELSALGRPARRRFPPLTTELERPGNVFLLTFHGDAIGCDAVFSLRGPTNGY